MYKRQILSSLNQWSESTGRKPLVLRGARQVGKTTAVQLFSKKFESFVYLNLEKTEDRQIFENNRSFPVLIDAIFFLKKKRRIENNTLIFIDEIQNCPVAIAQLRYFYEEAPGLLVIAAGSLLETLVDRQISFPVGRVDYLPVRPYSFFEFLGAIGENHFQEILQNWPTPSYAHRPLMEQFNRFALVGGMPGVVAAYAQNKELGATTSVFRSLLAGYTDDVEKYAPRASAVSHIQHIIRTGFNFAGQRIKFEQFGSSSYRSREMGEAFRTLEKAMLLELAYPTTSPRLPIIPDFKKSPKLLWLDTGLLNYAVGIQAEVFGSSNLNDAWRGLVAEHIVAQELLSNSNNVMEHRNFWVREAKNASSEVDFVVPFREYLIPIEVKSGVGSRLKSLHLFMDQAPHGVAVRFWSQPFEVSKSTTPGGKTYTLLNIPFYLLNHLNSIVSQFL